MRDRALSRLRSSTGCPGVGLGALSFLRGSSNSFFVSWDRAIVPGVRDTADDMLDEGRRGAREAFDEGWEKFDTKTRSRRAARTNPGRRGKQGVAASVRTGPRRTNAGQPSVVLKTTSRRSTG